MESKEDIQIRIEKSQEGSYFTLPFHVPKNISRIDIRYNYQRHVTHCGKNDKQTTEEKNIVDLALNDYNGNHLGSSGADRKHIFVSEYYSCVGYAEVEIKHGQWEIVVGAYKIADEGLTVNYEITFTHKERELIKGDLHMHSMGSDGVFTIEELSNIAIRNGLDFIFITDHNNFSHNYHLPKKEDIVIMPGVEWTNYKAHVNFLGVLKAFDGSFIANNEAEMKKKLKEAQQNGAIVSINHPFHPNCGFQFDIDNVEMDAIEIWNGFFNKDDMDCLKWWHDKLLAGKKIPVVGGGDFHRNEIGRGIGFPSTCLYAMSKAPSDIKDAIKGGNGYICFSPNGPSIYMEANGVIMGETVKTKSKINCLFTFGSVSKGDIIKIISDREIDEIEMDENYSNYTMNKEIDNIKFIRVEIWRNIEGLLQNIILISNPIYFE